jgi:hypothetical protein
MRKTIPLLVVGILVLAGLGAVNVSGDHEEEHIREFLAFSKPMINEKNDYVTIDFAESNAKSMETGKPIIPKYTQVYTLPFGTKVSDVVVTFSETNEKKISKPVEPAPEPQIVSLVHTNSNVETNQEIIASYTGIEIYPQNRYSYRTGAGLENGEHVTFLTVHLYPVQYKPSSDIIIYSDEATIEVDYEEPEKPVVFNDDYDLLIIAPAEFAGEFEVDYPEYGGSFIGYKNANGVETKLVTLEEIYGGEYFPVNGGDNQEKIKYFVRDAIEEWGITYLLLVGGEINQNDQITQQKFPSRYAYIPSGQYEDYFPSDLYYADIYNGDGGFSDWDKDEDGKYAELHSLGNDMDEVDMYPDVYLGKLPCLNSNQLKTVIQKTLYFEKHNKVTNKIVQIGGDTFPGDHDNVNEGEYANSEVLKKLPGYSSTELWASNGQLTKAAIADGFNDNVDFVDFSGHGSWASWATHAPDDDNVWLPPKTTISPYTGWLYIDYDMYRVTNENKFPVVIMNACSCNKYTSDPNCIGWKNLWMNGGGIATYAASGIGYGSYGYHEVERVWGWMEVHIFEGLYNTKNLGQVWGDAINGYINSFYEDDWHDTDAKTVIEMAMFGDPTLDIENGPDPKTRSNDRLIYNDILVKIIEKFPLLERLLNLLNRLF